MANIYVIRRMGFVLTLVLMCKGLIVILCLKDSIVNYDIIDYLLIISN